MSIFAGKPTVSDDFHGMSTCAERDDHSVNRAQLLFFSPRVWATSLMC